MIADMSASDMMATRTEAFDGLREITSEGPSEGTTTNEFLSLPDVVKETLLTQLAASGLHHLLKLRLLCQETKSWVDDSPPSRTKILFSKAQISLDCDVESVQRFLESPPPLPITDLSVHITKLRKIDLIAEPLVTPEERLFYAFAELTLNPSVENNANIPPGDSTEMWRKFCDFWSPRLTSLTIQLKDTKVRLRPNANQEIARVIRILLDSPHLEKVCFDKHWGWFLVSPFPTSFNKLTAICTGSLVRWPASDGTVRRFYATLMNNPNLKRVSLQFNTDTDVKSIQKFVEKNKTNGNLQLYLKNGNMCDMAEHYDSETFQAVIQLTKVLVECELQPRLDLHFYKSLNSFLARIKDEVEAYDYWKFLNYFERIETDRLPDPSLMEFGNLEKIRRLALNNMIRGTEVRFPPNLLLLEYGNGFPSIGNLPECLKELKLEQFWGTLDELQGSLISLSEKCVNLQNLKLTWFCEDKEEQETTEGKSGSGDRESVINFRALKSLTLKGYDHTKEIVREFLLNRMRLDQMSLLHLAVSFHSRVVFRRYHRDDEEEEDDDSEDYEDFEDYEDSEHSETSEDQQIIDPNYEAHNTPEFQEYLKRSCKDEEGTHSVLIDNLLQLIDGEMLIRLCDGPIGKSLLFMEIPVETVSLDGLQEFQKMKSIVAANVKTRVESEGRGPWLYEYPLQYEYYHG